MIRKSILQEINDLVDLLLVFLNINPNTLKGERKESFWNILYEILDFNIHTFDNTYIKPDIQFKGTFLETKISDFDATYLDQYNNKKEKVNFYKFISYIENIEEKYEKEANQTNLLDLIFTLIVGQFGKSSYSYNGFNFGTTLQVFAKGWKTHRLSNLDFKASDFEKRLFQLADVVKNFETIFKARYFGSLSDSKDSNEKIGSIPYFLIESHSTSRRKLHKKINKLNQELSGDMLNSIYSFGNNGIQNNIERNSKRKKELKFSTYKYNEIEESLYVTNDYYKSIIEELSGIFKDKFELEEFIKQSNEFQDRYVHRSYSEGIGMSPRLKDKRYHREYYISSSSKIKEQEAKIFYSNNEYSLDKKNNTQIG